MEAAQNGAGEMDMDEMQMAIQALSSLKGNPSSPSEGSSPADGGRTASKRPSEITLPPISTFLNGPVNGNSNGNHIHASNGSTPIGHPHHHSQNQHHQHQPHSSHRSNGVQYSYVSASNGHHRADNHGADSSASTSAYTYTPVTTPSGRTATSLSSPGSPSGYDHSAYFEDRSRGANNHAHFARSSDDHDYGGGALVRSNELQQVQQNGDDGFIGRVSQLPLVSGALRVYERGRNSSRVVKVRGVQGSYIPFNDTRVTDLLVVVVRHRLDGNVGEDNLEASHQQSSRSKFSWTD